MSFSDNKAKSRFELIEEGHTAFANYRRDDNVLSIVYVEAPEELRGKGTAGRLMQQIVDTAKQESLQVHPICPYAVHWLKRHSA